MNLRVSIERGREGDENHVYLHEYTVKERMMEKKGRLYQACVPQDQCFSLSDA